MRFHLTIKNYYNQMNNIVEISSRAFREHQKKYFDLADKGTQIVLKRGRNRAYVLTPLDDDDLYLTPAMLEKIQHSIEQAKSGNVKELKGLSDINALLGLSDE